MQSQMKMLKQMQQMQSKIAKVQAELEEEQVEVRRILAEMTAHLADEAPAIARAVEIMAEVELQFAKARFAVDYSCVRPELTDGFLELREARHPLLERNLRARGGKVVPLSLELDAAHRQLDRMLGTAAVTGVDGTLRLAVDPNRAADINQALVGSGIKVSELRADERTLEEVFLTLTGEAA